MTLDMTFEAREKIFRREEREEGRAEGRAEGREEGRTEGKLSAIIDFVKDGLCSVEEGARRAGMSVDDFATIMKAE